MSLQETVLGALRNALEEISPEDLEREVRTRKIEDWLAIQESVTPETDYQLLEFELACMQAQVAIQTTDEEILLAMITNALFPTREIA